MVSIGIIALLIGISFPFISAMTTGSRVEAGLNIVGMSSDVARQWVQAEAWANDGSTTAPTRESYSGTAAIFCPTGEIRIVSNHRMAAAASSDFLEDRVPELNGYNDLPQVDYIRIPVDVGIVGIYRDTSGVRFLAPPFAIAFNELGQLSYGNQGLIYYNSDGSTYYDLSKDRDSISGGYNPREWNGESGATNEDPPTGSLKRSLPFEAIECVPGVVVFDLEKFFAAGYSLDGGGEIVPSDTAEWQWLQDNGKTIFFSPHTGVALRDEQE